jgi:predicted TIM-barrel fold metal-dependent hydrolase
VVVAPCDTLGFMSTTKSAREIRQLLGHPVIDADGHQLELEPVMREYIERELGSDGVRREMAAFEKLFGWYSQSPAERRRLHTVRPPWGLQATNARDLATVLSPRLLYKRLDEFGIDISIQYPTMAVAMVRAAPAELRAGVCRAINRYFADSFRGLTDRLIPAAMVPMETPEAAIAVLEHAVRERGHKVIVIDCCVPRPIPALADLAAKVEPSVRANLSWLDSFAIDSDHDYDPFWRRCIELRVALTAHQAGVWGSRRSTSNYVHNHLGIFASAGEALCKSLFLGGVTFRFPSLRIGFLEGGAGWACSLYGDLFEHWEKRNRRCIDDFDPARLDVAALARELEAVAPEVGERLRANGFAATFPGLTLVSGWVPEAGWGAGKDAALLDDFAACRIERKQDIHDHFVPNFFFGCEAEDSSVAWASDRKRNKLGARLNTIFGSDIGHWDVKDPAHVLGESYEQVEEGSLGLEDYRAFMFDNAVRLHGGPNPSFFDDTVVASEAAKVLASG